MLHIENRLLANSLRRGGGDHPTDSAPTLPTLIALFKDPAMHRLLGILHTLDHATASLPHPRQLITHLETLILQLETTVQEIQEPDDFPLVCSGLTELSLGLSQMSPEQLREGPG
jgi:hypothetical protein